MKTTGDYDVVLATRTRTEKMGQSALTIHSHYKGDELIGEAFTLESLARCLGLPMSTMDGRYARGKLAKWNVPIINGYGRPARGFPFQLLGEVVAVITTKGACVAHDVNGSGTGKVKPVRVANELRPEYFGGKQYFTIPALAFAFNYSETTIRKKLERAGLMNKFINLASPMYGGRAKRGIPEKYLADIKLAVTEGLAFMGVMDKVLHEAGRTQAKADMQASIAPHNPPVPNSLRAWDRATMAPSVPTGGAVVNSVNPIASSQVGADLAAEIEQMMAVTAVPVVGEPEGVSLRAQQFQALVDDVDEPTDETLELTVYALELSKADADRFVAEVKAARAAKQ